MIIHNIELAASVLNEEGIIGLPTETVYGLAGNIFSEKAIKAIYQIKQRPLFNPLIVHIKSFEDLSTIAEEVPPIAIKLAKAFWPGPLTLLLKKKPLVPDLVTSGKATVAVRIPDHPIALALLNRIDFPLAAPSANPFGMISPTKAKHVNEYFKDLMILDGGECINGIESTIIGFQGNEVIVYRLGSITLDEIEPIAGKVSLINKNDSAPEAPGMLSKHYAPRTPLVVAETIQELIQKFNNKKIGLLLFSNTFEGLPENAVQIILSPNKNLSEAASKLYDALHQLDKLNLDIIIAEKLPEEGLGMVMNDKLRRASVET